MQNDTPTTAPHQLDSLRNVILASYGLLIVGPFFSAGVLALIGVVIAWLQRDRARDTLYESHVRQILRTTVISLVGGFIGLILMLVSRVIGILFLIALGLWYMYCMLKGVLRAYHREPTRI